MGSWRDDASAQAQNDLDELLDASLRLAQQQLAKAGEFYPFAMRVATSGEQGLVAVDLGNNQPQSTALIAALMQALAHDAAANRACAVVSDVRLNNGSDAIHVELEHRDGIALSVVLPYSRAGGEAPTYGELGAVEAQQRTWI
jgi:hypothetical protein